MATDLPTVQQMTALALGVLKRDLDKLVEIRREDPDWGYDDSEVDADMTVDLVIAHVERMRGTAFLDYEEFSRHWYRALAGLNLATKSFHRTGSWYYRVLKNARDTAAQVPRMAEVLTLQLADGAIASGTN